MTASAIPLTAAAPFAQPSALPFGAPDFGAIADADYQAAIEEAITLRLAEYQAIAANPAPPTFANTLVAMERAGQVFRRAYGPFSQKVGANLNPVLAAAEEALAPQLSQMSSAIFLNADLFARVKAVYDGRAELELTPEDARLLDTVYAEFVHRGALLSEAGKAELREINTRISQLSAQMSQQMTAAQNGGAILIDTRAELAGLSDGQIAAAAAAAKAKGHEGKYLLALVNTTSHPLLAALDNRAVRERLYRASIARNMGGQHDTLPAAAETIRLRARIAELTGHSSYADYQMFDRMVRDPRAAIGFMRDMIPALAQTQEREAALINERIAQDGHNFTVAPWDWPYYAELIRQERYDLDADEIAQYFVVDKVLEDGAFYVARQLYGLTFERRSDLPVYHPDVSVYTVKDEAGSDLALFYFDPFARESKRGGAWMNTYTSQNHLLGQLPVIGNTQNIPPPADGAPALMTFDEVMTLFHEFGHGLHTMLADSTYPSLSGTNTARDWVEFPSQFHEKFAVLPEVLHNYARHHATGEAIPETMIAAIERASRFNQGYDFGEVLAASLLDMEWHVLGDDAALPDDVMAFEEAALKRLGLNTDLVPPRYRTPYFRHIFGHEYQAGYYAYTWTEMLHHDAFDWVMENGGMTRTMGDHVRDTFLSRGNSRDYDRMFRDFAGREPRMEPLLEARGLLVPAA